MINKLGTTKGYENELNKMLSNKKYYEKTLDKLQNNTFDNKEKVVLKNMYEYVLFYEKRNLEEIIKNLKMLQKIEVETTDNNAKMPIRNKIRRLSNTLVLKGENLVKSLVIYSMVATEYDFSRIINVNIKDIESCIKKYDLKNKIRNKEGMFIFLIICGDLVDKNNDVFYVALSYKYRSIGCKVKAIIKKKEELYCQVTEFLNKNKRLLKESVVLINENRYELHYDYEIEKYQKMFELLAKEKLEMRRRCLSLRTKHYILQTEYRKLSKTKNKLYMDKLYFDKNVCSDYYECLRELNMVSIIHHRFYSNIEVMKKNHLKMLLRRVNEFNCLQEGA